MQKLQPGVQTDVQGVPARRLCFFIGTVRNGFGDFLHKKARARELKRLDWKGAKGDPTKYTSHNSVNQNW